MNSCSLQRRVPGGTSGGSVHSSDFTAPISRRATHSPIALHSLLDGNRSPFAPARMSGVYPSTYVHSLFDGVPSSLSWDLVEAAFRRRVRTGAMLVGVSASTGKVSVAVSADFLNTTAGRAAWRRYKRAQFHLERAASGQQLRSDVLLVMDLKDMVSPREPSDGAVPVAA